MSQKVRLRSTARHLYGGRSIVSGQEFDVDNEQDAEDLIALHFAVRVPVVMTTEQAAALITEPHKPRTYRRRDMKAEE